jgi:pimeloyl-ACP methyl ester carboxylesterase
MRWPKILRKRRRLWGVSLGAGLVGAAVFAVRYALRPPPRARLPEVISPAIFSTRVLYTSRGQIVYHESGEGDPLLFLHGVYVGASSYEWSKVYPHLAGTHQVLALDLLGFGESERPERALTTSDQVQAVAEFVRAKCGGVRATIVASGLAGGFAAQLAAQHPDLVGRLLLLMPIGLREFGRQRIRRHYNLFTRIPVVNRAYYRRYLSTRTQISFWLRSAGFSDQTKINDEMIEVMTNCARQSGAERAVFQWLSGRFNVELERRLGELIQPITLLWAEKAGFPPVDWAYRLQTIPGRCALAVLENTGLLAPLETPQQVTDVLIRELDPRIRIYKAG